MANNIYHVNVIEGLLSEINAHLEMVNPHNSRQLEAKEQTVDDINELQTGTLYNLRVVCEGDPK